MANSAAISSKGEGDKEMPFLNPDIILRSIASIISSLYASGISWNTTFILNRCKVGKLRTSAS